MESIWHPNFNALESGWPQRDPPTVCVIAQQYSSTSLILMSSRKEMSGAHYQNITPIFFNFSSCLNQPEYPYL